MRSVLSFLRSKYLRNQSGAAAAEYALILAIIGSGIALAAVGLGSAISNALSGASSVIAASRFSPGL